MVALKSWHATNEHACIEGCRAEDNRADPGRQVRASETTDRSDQVCPFPHDADLRDWFDRVGLGSSLRTLVHWRRTLEDGRSATEVAEGPPLQRYPCI